jgi:hypothetical protein
MESYDVSTDLEALLLGLAPASVTPSQLLDPATNKPLDMRSMFKAGQSASNPFAVVDSVGLPFLFLEQLNYRFGLKDDARQTATLRGDSIYYNPGTTYVEVTPGTGVSGQNVPTANPAYGVTEGGVFRRVLNVAVGNKRMTFGVDYTETYGATLSGGPATSGAAVTTVVLTNPTPPGANVRIMYSSPTAGNYPQNSNAPVAVKPAAIRGRDINIYLGGYTPGSPYLNRVAGVQACTADWKVTLQKDEEFGNYHFVIQDFEVPQVSGTVQVKPVDAPTLIALMQKISGTADVNQSSPASAAPPMQLDIVLTNPLTGVTLKHISIPDARFTMPGFSGRVQQKLDVTMNWASDTGSMAISKT